MGCDGPVRMQLSQEELTLLLGGIDLTQTKARAWYRKTPSEHESRLTSVVQTVHNQPFPQVKGGFISFI
jgi:hypothetical protein